MNKLKKEKKEQYEKFKNKNNLMKYVNELVEEIKFYEDRRIVIKLKYYKNITKMLQKY